jgi:hypothetical protein
MGRVRVVTSSVGYAGAKVAQRQPAAGSVLFGWGCASCATTSCTMPWSFGARIESTVSVRRATS